MKRKIRSRMPNVEYWTGIVPTRYSRSAPSVSIRRSERSQLTVKFGLSASFVNDGAGLAASRRIRELWYKCNPPRYKVKAAIRTNSKEVKWVD